MRMCRLLTTDHVVLSLATCDAIVFATCLNLNGMIRIMTDTLQNIGATRKVWRCTETSEQDVDDTLRDFGVTEQLTIYNFLR